MVQADPQVTPESLQTLGITLVQATHENWQDWIRYFDPCQTLAVDTETTGLNPYGKDHIVGISISDGKYAVYWAFGHETGDNLPKQPVIDRIRELFAPNPKFGPRTLLFWNAQFDLKMLLADVYHHADEFGIRRMTDRGPYGDLPFFAHDVMVAAYLMNEHEPNFKLKDTADRYFGAGTSRDDKILQDRLRKLGYHKAELWRLPPEDVSNYAASDVALTWRLEEMYAPYLKQWGLDEEYERYSDYTKLLTKIEWEGVPVNPDKIIELRDEANIVLAESTKNINELAGRVVNLNSTPQLRALTGLPNTRAESLIKVMEAVTMNDESFIVLDDVSGEGVRISDLTPKSIEVIRQIGGFRAYSKMVGSYYTPYLTGMVNHSPLSANADWRVHCDLQPIGTQTSRLSARNPNLQAVPRYDLKAGAHRRVKELFIAPHGFLFGENDYSQAEMRVGSSYGNVDRMIEILARGGDMHGETATSLGIPRDAAKRINFGVLYGIGARKLARNLGIPFSEASRYLNLYRGMYPGFVQLYNSLNRLAKAQGSIRIGMIHYDFEGEAIPPISNQVRRYPTIEKIKDGRLQQFQETQKAMSNLVQGTVAKLIMLAMLKLDTELGQPGNDYAQLIQILQVHDSVPFLTPVVDDPRLLANTVSRAREIMVNAWKFRCPMAVDTKIGSSWATAKAA